MLIYTRTLNNEEEKILLDSVLDVKDWIDKSIDGKISSCTGRLADRRREDLIKKGDKTIPASELDLSRNALGDPGYKNRIERDLESARKRG